MRSQRSAARTWCFARVGCMVCQRSEFLATMLRLAAERDELRVVADQFGVPNWSRGASLRRSRQSSARPAGSSSSERGSTDLSAGGAASWFDFARAIIGDVEATARGANHDSQYPTPHDVRAVRCYPPANSPRLSAWPCRGGSRCFRRASPSTLTEGGPRRSELERVGEGVAEEEGISSPAITMAFIPKVTPSSTGSSDSLRAWRWLDADLGGALSVVVI